jgi:hypothetical protein
MDRLEVDTAEIIGFSLGGLLGCCSDDRAPCTVLPSCGVLRNCTYVATSMLAEVEKPLE